MLVQSRVSAGGYTNLAFRHCPPISTDIRGFGCTLAARSKVVSEMSLALYSNKNERASVREARRYRADY
jgi:hypothetical protein